MKEKKMLPGALKQYVMKKATYYGGTGTDGDPQEAFVKFIYKRPVGHLGIKNKKIVQLINKSYI